MAHTRAVLTSRGAGLSALGLVPIGFLVVFFAWPVLAIVGRGFSAGGVGTVLSDAQTWRLAWFTAVTAATSTVVSLVAGLPVAFLLARVKLPGVARTVGGLWARLDSRAVDAARALGASPWRAFRSVTLPALAPALASAAAVVFLFCATSFGVVLILGGARYRTLENVMYQRKVNLLELSGAAALSLIQFAAVVAALAVGALA